MDSYGSLTEREKRFLDKSWTKVFLEKIFPKIDEVPYAVLYSQNASRLNTSVNVMIGALIPKKFIGASDNDSYSSLMFDIHCQYVLHTTSFIEQSMKERTLGRFRDRCLSYESKKSVDLLHNTITSFSQKMAEMMKIDRSLKRMDSMMATSNIKK